MVGAFVLVLSAVLVAGVLWLVSGGQSQRHVDLYLAIEDESVSGLNVNAPVKYNGVDVGTVRDIQLDPSNLARVRLVFAIRHGTPIKTDTEAVLKTQGLTGIAYVELDGGSSLAPPLRAAVPGEYPEIRTKPSLSARLENVLTTVLVKLDGTTARIDAMLSDKNQRALTDTLENIAAVSHMLAARKTTLDAGIISAARTFDEAQRLAAQLGPVIDRIGLAADSLDKMGKETGLASNQVRSTVAAVGTQTMPEIQNLLAELEALSVSLRQLVQKIDRRPSSLLLGDNPIPEGPGETSPRQTKP